MTLHFGLEDFLTECPENLTDPWLEWVNMAMPVNESIHSHTLVGMVRALVGFFFVSDGYHSPWAHECVDTWLVYAGRCLLGYLCPLLSITEDISLVDSSGFISLSQKGIIRRHS